MSLEILKLKSLEKRIGSSHAVNSEVKSELSKRLAGHKGEQSLLYYLRQLPEKEHFIFHNLRLQERDYYFQIDFLVLTKYSIGKKPESKNNVPIIFFVSSINANLRGWQMPPSSSYSTFSVISSPIIPPVAFNTNPAASAGTSKTIFPS